MGLNVKQNVELKFFILRLIINLSTLCKFSLKKSLKSSENSFLKNGLLNFRLLNGSENFIKLTSFGLAIL